MSCPTVKKILLFGTWSKCGIIDCYRKSKMIVVLTVPKKFGDFCSGVTVEKPKFGAI